MESRPTLPDQPTVSEPSASVAEGLPELYRQILDRVADLERMGARNEAARIRSDATRTYSNAWDERARRVLTALIARADRTAAAPPRMRHWSLRRRSVFAR
jgi:putative protein kinase ArgK-like GTPase of G3E family